MELEPPLTQALDVARQAGVAVLYDGTCREDHVKAFQPLGVAFARVDTPGAVFGEMSAVLDRPATATVRAVGETTVRRVADPVRFLDEHPGAALAVLRTTASRLDGLTQYLVDVKRQFSDAEGHLGMVDAILDQLVHHQGPRPQTGSARDPEGDHGH